MKLQSIESIPSAKANAPHRFRVLFAEGQELHAAELSAEQLLSWRAFAVQTLAQTGRAYPWPGALGPESAEAWRSFILERIQAKESTAADEEAADVFKVDFREILRKPSAIAYAKLLARLGAVALRIYLALLAHARAGTLARFSLAEMVRATGGKCEKSVRNALRELERERVIVRLTPGCSVARADFILRQHEDILKDAEARNTRCGGSSLCPLGAQPELFPRTPGQEDRA